MKEETIDLLKKLCQDISRFVSRNCTPYSIDEADDLEKTCKALDDQLSNERTTE